MKENRDVNRGAADNHSKHKRAPTKTRARDSSASAEHAPAAVLEAGAAVTGGAAAAASAVAPAAATPQREKGSTKSNAAVTPAGAAGSKPTTGADAGIPAPISAPGSAKRGNEAVAPPVAVAAPTAAPGGKAPGSGAVATQKASAAARVPTQAVGASADAWREQWHGFLGVEVPLGGMVVDVNVGDGLVDISSAFRAQLEQEQNLKAGEVGKGKDTPDRQQKAQLQPSQPKPKDGDHDDDTDVEVWNCSHMCFSCVTDVRGE